MKRILSFTLLLSLFSCSSDKKNADAFLQKARTQFEADSFNNAKLYIDSIKTVYPKEFDVIKQGNQLMRQIELKEQQRSLVYINTTLAEKKEAAETLKKNFSYEKNEYQDLGEYYIKSSAVERNVERNYLRSRVDEKGDISLASVYFGKGNINHTSIKVETNDGTFAQTDIIPYDGGRNYRFSDNGNKSEIVTYKKGKDNGVHDFITYNVSQRLNVTYLGDKKYVMLLDDQTKKSIYQRYELANLISDIVRLEQEKKHDEGKIY